MKLIILFLIDKLKKLKLVLLILVFISKAIPGNGLKEIVVTTSIVVTILEVIFKISFSNASELNKLNRSISLKKGLTGVGSGSGISSFV